MNNDIDDTQFALYGILETKLATPVTHKDIVVRDRLFAQLDSNPRPVNLIYAPAGFGKTTLLAHWLRKQRAVVAWLSLDKDDNDERRFLFYVATSINKQIPSFGEKLLQLFDSRQPLRAATVLSIFLDEIKKINVPLFLAFDDFHLIENSVILGMLKEIALSKVKNLTLGIASRTAPIELGLDELRSADLVNEIVEADLRFNLFECTQLFRSISDLQLTDQDISALSSRTDGWIAGLHLAILSLEREENRELFVEQFSGSHIYITDYLTDEVLKHQPEEIKQFLLQSSILRLLSGDLCNHVLNISNSTDILELLLTKNIFLVSLDDSGTWYRYHHLFADLLRSQLDREGKGSVRELHRKACDWFIANDFPYEAAYHSLTAIKDYNLAIKMMGRFGRVLTENGQISTVMSWYQQIPKRILIKHPARFLGMLWSEYLQSCEVNEILLQELDGIVNNANSTIYSDGTSYTETFLRLFHAVRAMQNHDLKTARQLSLSVLRNCKVYDYPMAVSARLVLAVSLLNQGLLYRAIPIYQQAINDTIATEYLVIMNFTIAGYARALMQLGRLEDANSYLLNTLPLHKKRHWDRYLTNTSHIYLVLSSIAFRRNKLELCKEYLTKARELALQDTWLIMSTIVDIYSLRLDIAMGDKADIYAKIHSLNLNHALPLIPYYPPVNHMLCDIYLRLGDWEKAQSALGMATEEQVIESTLQSEYVSIAILRIVLLQKQPDLALKLVKNVRLSRAKSQSKELELVLLVIEALAKIQKLDNKQAQQNLLEAFMLAKASGYIRIFLDCIVEIRPQLTKIAKDSTESGLYARFILSEAEKGKIDKSNLLNQGEKKLTASELKILRLLALGKANKDIAEEMQIKVNTVKSHVRSIFSKLNMSNRIEAIEKYDEIIKKT